MSKMIGRIEVLSDPPALARHVAEWMTATALASSGPEPSTAASVVAPGFARPAMAHGR